MRRGCGVGLRVGGVGRWLFLFCREKIDEGKFLVPANWLAEILHDELTRREDPSMEIGMLALPNWNPTDLSEALIFVFCLSKHGLTLDTASFVDVLLKHIVCDSAAMLDLLGDKKYE